MRIASVVRTVGPALVAGLIAVSLAPGLATASAPAGGEVAADDADALAADAAEYARAFGVSTEEAHRRLRLQEDIGRLGARLARSYPDTFAGLWIDHTPDFAVTVAFTARADEVVAKEVPSELAPITSASTAKASVAELTRQAEGILEAGSGFDLNIDVRGGRVEVLVAEPGWAGGSKRHLPDTGISVPPGWKSLSNAAIARVRSSRDAAVVAVPSLASPAASTYGGLSLSTCTSGFAVRKNSNGGTGITTAGHCGDIQRYMGTNLPMWGDRHDTYYDIQWHTTPGFTDQNWAHDGLWDSSTPYYREIRSTRHRANMSIGDWVCKYGKSSFYGCGMITSKTYAPTNTVDDAEPRFLRLHRQGVDLCKKGDSGGPFYRGTRAYGTMTACVGDDAIWMASNYFAILNLSILTSPPS